MGGLTRKELLAGAVAAGVVAGCGSSPRPAAFDPRDWAAVKAQFPLAPGIRHFDAFVLATHPKAVREAIERHRRGLDADPAGFLHAHEAEQDERVAQAAAGCHKWLGGPRGTGLVWSIKAWDWLKPIIPSFHPTGVGPDAATWTPGGFHSFEHRWALAEAFDFHTRLGRTRVAERIRSLATRLKEGLAELPRVRLVTPMSPDVSAGIVCCEVDGLDPATAVERLRREHEIAASVTPYEQPYVRFGTGLWVDEHDVDAALDAVGRL